MQTGQEQAGLLGLTGMKAAASHGLPRTPPNRPCPSLVLNGKPGRDLDWRGFPVARLSHALLGPFLCVGRCLKRSDPSRHALVQVLVLYIGCVMEIS